MPALPEPVTNQFRIVERGGSTYLMPEVGSAFAEEVSVALLNWLRSANYFATRISKQRIAFAETENSPNVCEVYCYSYFSAHKLIP